MARYDGLIIPRSYNDYINKSSVIDVQEALQLTGVMDDMPIEDSNKPIKSGGVDRVLKNAQTLNQLINKLPTGTSNAQLNDYIVAQYAGGVGNTFYRRPLNKVLGAVNKTNGLEIGNIFIEYIDVALPNGSFIQDGAIYSRQIEELYTFTHSYNNPPIVIIESQNNQDYSYNAIAGMVVTKTSIKNVKLIRNTTGTGGNIKIKGIAIGS